jgi:hypothetical protein
MVKGIDEEAFNEELKRYRTVRKPDYIKVRLNRKAGDAKSGRKALTSSEDLASVDTSSGDTEAGFWEKLESALRSVDGTLTQAEINKFTSSLRHEHGTLAPKLNLSDLDVIASSLLPN